MMPASLLDPPQGPDATDYTNPVSAALGELYKKVTGYMNGTPEMAFRYADNPVGTETTQSIGMPQPTNYSGPVGQYFDTKTGQMTTRGHERYDDNPAMNFDSGGIGLMARRAATKGLLAGALSAPDVAPPPSTTLLGAAAGEARLPPSVARLNPDAVGFNDRISTRLPSLTPDAHTSADYNVDYDSFLAPTKNPARDAYPGRVDEVIPRHVGVTDPSAEGFIDHLTGNIRALWDAVPDTWRGGAMGWYNGARTMAENMADRFGTSVRAQAANLAALSPQRQWEHNVEGSHRVADIVTNQSDTPWSADHDAAWNQPKTLANGNVQPSFAENNPGWQEHFDAIQGKTLSQITDPTEAALWVRLHDRAYAPDNNVRIVKPDGTFGDMLRLDDGRPDPLRWGTLGDIGNAISVLRDDSLPNISQSLSQAHKVRNFYNNIVSPDGGHDVTIDTHAIAGALLRPLGSSNPEVSYGLGSPVKVKPWRAADNPDPWPTTMDSAPRGLSGMYPLYAEAYRRVADNLGVLPRQVQSVTWEGIRGLYNEADRTSKPLMRSNNDLWRSVSDGTVNPADARSQLLARGIRDPNWHAP
jgi:hypothetical protein